MARPITITIACCVAALQAWPPVRADEPVSGDAEISAPAGASRIVIKTTTRTAGAIDSLTWNGVEFIDSFDHGRQLQSAANFDAGSKFTGETFNPTEAGSRADGRGPTSTSLLLSVRAEGNRLETDSFMAFWLRPGEESGGHPAKNTTALSNHRLRKRVTIGPKDLRDLDGSAHVIEYRVTFTVPPNERHTLAQFEAVTGYMPPTFSRFLTYDAEKDAWAPLSDGPGEQSRPVVLSTPSGDHAMGVYSPGQPSPGYEHAGYGRWRFINEKVVKWNCVFRVRDPKGVKPGDYTYTCYVIVGSLADVKRAMRGLERRAKRKG